MITLTPLGWAVITMSVLIGSAGGYFVFKRFPNLFNNERKINKIIKDPNLLLEKLKANGKLYEEGENGKRAEIDLKIGIDVNSGKEIIMMEKIESKVKKTKKIVKEKIQDKKKVKKKIKKKRKKGKK